MKFLEIFSEPKPVMAMLHLKGDNREERLERCLKEAAIYAENGVDAMIVEDYFGDEGDVEAALQLLQGKGYCLGVNVLDNLPRSYELAEQYGAAFIQADSVSGHLAPEDDPAFAEMVAGYRARGDIGVIGGVRFKYQPVLSGRSLEEDLRLGMERCDAIAVTGVGTGSDSPTEKIAEFRAVCGEDFPLVVAAGVTPENAAEKLEVADAVIIGSALKDTGKDTGDVSPEKVREFMDAVRAIRAK